MQATASLTFTPAFDCVSSIERIEDKMRLALAREKDNKDKGKETVGAVMLDEMAIRKHIEYAQGRYLGFVDIGSGLTSCGKRRPGVDGFRARGRFINNPTAGQYQAAYKRLLMRYNVKNGTGNCILMDDTTILNVSEKTQSSPASAEQKYDLIVRDHPV
ncbi:hypothetical protein HOLleu_16411 [Holothuria leucospilota]|uniref:Transposable element P transposase-like RNase H domain-containing protein n=1 Tax=Holothuria leucospilota TaxID=206669 RepID=A0A9Q1C6M5_HOLLE|nr:hypothetical protein HOLleu_16411 [Holothuria leucospilota]